MSTPGQLVAERGSAAPASGTGGTGGTGIFRRLISKPSVAVCFGFLTMVILMAIFAPLITAVSGHDPYVFDQAAIDANTGGLPKGPFGGISAEHWFGVEPQNGRDIFARIVHGARASMAIALSATVLTTVFGTVLGMVAGFFGGRADQIVSRLMDFLMAFPALIFMIALLSALPDSNRPLLLVGVLSVFGWPYIARVIRGQTMSLSKREFVEAAIASGGSRLRVIFTELLPNLTGTIIVMSTLAVPSYIGTEAGLSFLGIGLTPPTPSWGQMIAKAVSWYTVDPAYFMIPGLFLFLTVLSFTLIGDQLQRILDPRGGLS
ncbi:ABC transporter permease [Microlunatus soli]|uniref:Peptide/nickel transport system permease protein n=1 Tax=Microlunatus soli TaxID=630515 RepID=A0A1H1SID0_9ACTN|nr:ABC transporter permease [Microlunatus soli]SDS47578.1 peptide/nickel transport system permease protein [Microlunatus soli]